MQSRKLHVSFLWKETSYFHITYEMQLIVACNGYHSKMLVKYVLSFMIVAPLVNLDFKRIWVK